MLLTGTLALTGVLVWLGIVWGDGARCDRSCGLVFTIPTLLFVLITHALWWTLGQSGRGKSVLYTILFLLQLLTLAATAFLHALGAAL